MRLPSWLAIAVSDAEGLFKGANSEGGILDTSIYAMFHVITNIGVSLYLPLLVSAWLVISSQVIRMHTCHVLHTKVMLPLKDSVG